MAGRNGTLTVARFNRRMLKTARPVVWEGLGAQSSVTRPDKQNPTQRRKDAKRRQDGKIFQKVNDSLG